ncbi:hypothetical protein COH34_12505 [Neisseria meningitidis]|uniref:hypothetical protein n=1 Tax=Neisseria meningitidis TaxID=487 RepID=UPI000F450831|nr:hypothetical protein [Neisseria meningitidis]RNJ94665.1 hypothetical protein COI36_12580 [Neisseria meningitidis]RQJ61711.1 hypothetical protein COI15_12670 [Neisseria meningitidis]RQJ94054.1 hypothetical protein COI12_12590 [Neisseria meningitidis]RQK55624.1 hypothetical protein COH60_12550 [Neisseria meningitidis]RQK60355.1 hypothetical protein COH62_12235 [Neisseria meningitidis]
MSNFEKKYILELNDALSHLNHDSTSFDLLKVLISWLSNDIVIDKFKILGYDFSKYIEMNPDDYPVEKSILNREEIIYLKNNIYRKISSGNFKFQYFVQYIRDILEYLFIEHIERVCPYCEWGEMQKLEEQNTHETVYLCTQCGCAFYNDNSQFLLKTPLTIPMKRDEFK